jgi:alpha-beta hydrolase superfamily lysophospholipase
MPTLVKWVVRSALAVALIVATVIIGAAFNARSRVPDLKPWHRLVPAAELRAADFGPRFTFDDYLKREAAVFDEVRTRIEDRLAPEDRSMVNRYDRTGRSSPSRLPRDWNRTIELIPADIRGGALLVHGLTDAPYSMRAVAESLQERGFYALAMRMPGHGAVPAGLTSATWPDWLAAVRLGVRRVRQRVGSGRPIVLVGYSNGGALVVKYAIDALDDQTLPRADRLVLISPMIGVTPFSRLARFVGALGFLPYFEKAHWLDVIPEYSPFKFNSFPTNAGLQTFLLTRALHADLARVARDGRIAHLPAALTFQSLVDSTIVPQAVVTHLYDRLRDNGSELVVFDINRLAGLEAFMRPSDREMLDRLMRRKPRAYRLTVVTNASRDSLDVVARSEAAGARETVDTPTGMAWPPDTFSLSHIALPFPPNDPVFGRLPDQSVSDVVRLGTLSPRGERAVLTVPVDTLMRVSSNPFYPYVDRRIREWVDALK